MRVYQECYFCDLNYQTKKSFVVKQAARNIVLNTFNCVFKIILILLLVFYLVPSVSSHTFLDQQYSTKQTSDTLEQLILLSEMYWPTDRNKSDSLISKAFTIIAKERPDDSPIIADAYHMLGKVHIYRNRVPQGISALKKSLQIKQILNTQDQKSIAKTINYIGIGFLYIQKYDSAIYFFSRSKELLIENNIYGRNLHDTYLNIGISYANIGKYSISIIQFDSALIALEKSGEVVDSMVYARYYNNYALITTLTGKLKVANNYFEKAEAIFIAKNGDNSISIASINNNKGGNSYYNFEFSKAKLYYNKALDIYLAKEPDSKQIPLIYYNLSQISQNEGDYKSSIDYCHSGLEYLPSNDLRLILYNTLADSYTIIGNIEQANKYFNNSLELLEKGSINPKRNHVLYSSYADFLINNGQKQLGLEFHKKAQSSVKSLYGDNSDEYGLKLAHIGNYFLKTYKQADSAIYYYEYAISILDNNKNKTEAVNLDIIETSKAHIGLASSLILKNKQDNEISLLLKADTIFAKVLDQMDVVINNLSSANKLILINLMSPVYNMAIENSFDLFTITSNNFYLHRIFNYTERSKSSALLSAVNSELALKTSDIPDNIFNYEHQLQDEINGLRQLLEKEETKNNPNKKNISFFQSKLLTQLNTYDSLIGRIEKEYPKYYSVKYNREVISPDQIKQNLSGDEAFIEYQITDSVLYMMVITDSEFEIKHIPIDENFYNSLNYIISIKNVDLNQQNNKRFTEFKHHSFKLWETLIGPANSMLIHKRLIIIPDGMLGYLPFDLLIEYNFETDGINYRDLPYLIINHPVSYSYSATLKYNTYFDSNNKNTSQNIVAFAPLYSGKNQQPEKLPFAKSEVVNIINDFGGQSFYDHGATKNKFIEYASSGNILHLAMHTIINDSLPMQSKLIFYKNCDDSASNYMFTHEIYNMNINASMVTLSACNTGSGKLSKGEGIMSLSRGFVYAGVPSIIMTLWEVQDESGSLIMNKFYQNLDNGMTKDAALQQAKISVLKDANMAKAHPFFWSTYIISGDTSVINVSSGNNKYYYWGITISLLLITMIIYSNRSKKIKKLRI